MTGERPHPLLWIVTGLVLAYLAVPSLLVVIMSFSGGLFLEFPPRTWSVRWYEAYWSRDRKSTRLNSSHSGESRMPSSA